MLVEILKEDLANAKAINMKEYINNQNSKENLEKYVVIADCGKNSTKTLIINEEGVILSKQSFPSKIEEHIGRWHSEKSDKVTNMEIDNKKYKVGLVSNNKYNSDDTKINEFHRNLVYTSIARHMFNANINNIEIKLTVGLPATHSQNEENVENYEKLMFGKNNGVVTVKIYGEEKTFSITKVSIYSEGDATLQRKSLVNIYPKKDIQVLDIGGQNIGYVLFKNGQIRMTSDSLERAGMNYLTAQLSTDLSSKLINNNAIEIDFDKAILINKINEISDSDLNQDYFKTTTEFINYYIKEYIQENIISLFARKGIDLKDHNKILLLTGGGSTRLYSYIKELLPKVNVTKSDIARWDNCVSYALLELKDIHKPTKNSKNKADFIKSVATFLETVKSGDFAKKYDIIIDL